PYTSPLFPYTTLFRSTSWNRIGYITKLAMKAYDELFIASSSGIHTYNTKNQIFNNITHLFENFAALDIYDIQSLNNQLFICTKKGLYTINYKDTPYQLTPLITDKAVFTVS